MKRVLTSISMVALLLAAIVITSCSPPVSYSYTPLTMTFAEMQTNAVAMVRVTVLSERYALDIAELKSSNLVFMLTDLRVDAVEKGNLKIGDQIKIIQTKDIPIDIPMRAGESYLLFLSDYQPGDFDEMRRLNDTYVVLQRFKGVFRIDARQRLMAYDINGKEIVADAAKQTEVQNAFSRAMS